MDREDRDILDRFRALASVRVNIERLILFGSRARGDAGPESDMDIVVVANDLLDDDTRDFISDCAWEAGYPNGVVVVPVIFSAKEWDTETRLRSLLSRAVEQEGIPA